MKKYSEFTDDELALALELLVTRDDLKIREAAEALLDVFSYTAQDVRSQLESHQYLSDGEPLKLVI